MSGLFPEAELPDARAVRGGGVVPRAWPFAGLAMGHYGVILADPPWRFANYSEAGEAKNPVAHYPCMDLADLKALPVGALAAPDCALVMWGIWPMVRDAVELVDAWGFVLKSGGVWAKQSSTGASWAFGTGYLYRAASEFWLLATQGSPAILSRSIRNLIVAPVREHSRKPDQMHHDLEALFAGPRCELFARQARPGWDVWGNQTDRFQDNAGEGATA